MTEGVYNGSQLRIYLDDKIVYHATNCSIDFARETKERATKDTAGTEVSLGKKSWTASGDGLAVAGLPTAVTATAKNFEQLFDAYDAGTRLPFKFTLGDTGVSGDTFYSGFGYITSLSLASPVDEDATATFSVTGDGNVVKDVIVIV